MPVTEKQLHFAKSYPFESPSASYLYTAKGPQVIDIHQNMAALTEGRTPVLAYGSNSAPIQLKRKFGSHLEEKGGFIPVIRGELSNYDVVYSPIIVPYGSIPATIAYSPGVKTNAYITYLNHEQIEMMHRSEGVGYMYDYLLFDQKNIHLEHNQCPLVGFHTYLSRRGALKIDGEIIALSEVASKHRSFPAMNQLDILTMARDISFNERTLDDFISNCIEDRTFRSSVNGKLLELFSDQ